MWGKTKKKHPFQLFGSKNSGYEKAGFCEVRRGATILIITNLLVTDT